MTWTKEGGRKMSKRYTIILAGCDDITYFDMELTQEEYALLQKVSEMSKEASSHICMPVMRIEEVNP